MNRLHGLACLLTTLVTLYGCSPGEPAPVRRPARGSAGAQSSVPPALTGEGGGAATPDSPPISRPDQPIQPAAAGAMQTSVCARDRYKAEQKPLTIYTLFDESLSMVLWWAPVSEAFSAFVRDPGSAGINIGLKFFGTDCKPEAYSVPDVAIGPLPENAEAIAAELASHAPLAQTPTKQAMQGAMLALGEYAASHPEEKTVILLVTDASSGIGEGDAEDCYSTVAQAAEIAAQAYAARPSIETYVLGLGDAAGLNTLSQAGGTGDAISADPSASAMVVAAIREIRRRALPCSYALPPGAERNPGLVNLERIDADGTAATIPGVSQAGECDAVTGGWYYDDPRAPRQILSCRATCDSFAGASEVNVILGCPTIGPD